jgi:hypothetical protein
MTMEKNKYFKEYKWVDLKVGTENLLKFFRETQNKIWDIY